MSLLSENLKDFQTLDYLGISTMTSKGNERTRRKSVIKITISLCFIAQILWLFCLFYITDSPTSKDYAPKYIIENTRYEPHNNIVNTLNNFTVFEKQEKEHECFESPYVICGEDESKPWTLAEKLRQKMVDQNMSTLWLPIVKELETAEKTNITTGNSITSIALNNTTTNGTVRTIKIAVHHRPPYVALESFEFSKCEYNNCKYVGKKNTKYVDALVVTGVELQSEVKLPRWPNQIFVMLGWEPPVYYGDLTEGKDDWWNWAFNMTINYRISSDIFAPYAFLKYEPKPADKLPDYAAIARGKTKMVAWILSDCHVPSYRLEYVKELKKHIDLVDIDVYGKCGKPCPKYPNYCNGELGKYRFYLSFENSICDDYVTEKFFKAFNKLVIPVVRGGTDYQKYFPPQTYIDAKDFSTPKALAEELIKLSSDVETYSRYLKNIDEYRVFGCNNDFTCQLCKKLNMVEYSKSTYYDMKTWLGVNTHCRIPRDF